jgi:hypothetical protein
MADWLVATLRGYLRCDNNPVHVYLTLHSQISSSDLVCLRRGAWIGAGGRSFPALGYGIRRAMETPHSPSSEW